LTSNNLSKPYYLGSPGKINSLVLYYLYNICVLSSDSIGDKVLQYTVYEGVYVLVVASY